jgi:hypothetical protein
LDLFIPLVADADGLAVRELVILCGMASFSLLLGIERDVAELFFSLAYYSCVDIGWEARRQKLCQIVARQVSTCDSGADGEALVTRPVVRPDAHKARRASRARKHPSTPNVSNIVSIVRSRLVVGVNGASVRSTACSSGAELSSL